MDLKPSDIKLLVYLYHNNREPLTKIAKATGLSREQVEYKINKYLSLGLIKKFATFFNYNALGYNYLAVLMVKFSKPGYSADFYSKTAQDRHCISRGFVFNKYDIYLNLIFKDEGEFREYLAKLLEENKEISGYFLLKPYFSELYPLKFFQSKKGSPFEIANPSTQVSLDKKDVEILKMLEKDGRTKAIDIARALQISPELALYKLKSLYKKNVIIGSRIIFDMEKLGYFFSLLAFNIRNLSKANQGKIKSFARNSPYVNSLHLVMSQPNCFVQLFHKEESELRDQIGKIKGLFAEDSLDIEVLLIEGEKEASTLPFL